MHIMMVTDFYWPMLGGVEQHVRSLSHELLGRGHRVTVVTQQLPGRDDREADGGVDVARIPTAVQRLPGLYDQARPWAPPVNDPLASRSIRRLVGELAPDVLHVHDWLGRSAFGASVGRPIVSTLHYYTLSCAKKDLMRSGRPCPGPGPVDCVRCAGAHYGWVKGGVTAAANAVGAAVERRMTSEFIAVSAATARGNGLSPDDDNIHVIPNFLPPSGTPPSPGDDERLAQLPTEPFFLYVGDFRSVKGYDVLLAAYAGLETDRPLVVIGKRWPTSPEHAPPGVVVFEEWPNSAVRRAYERAWAAVVPSVWAEPFGIVAIEALTAGVPVIASATGGLVDLVDDGSSGRLVPPGSVGGLRGALKEIDGDGDLRGRWSGHAREAAKRYRAASVVPRIEAVYDRAHAGARR